MRARLIASVGVLAVVLAVLFLRAPAPGASIRLPEGPGPRRSVPPPRPANPAPPWPARDPFRYADERREGSAPVPPPRSAPSPPPAVASASPNPMRLVGLVRKGGALKAAVSMWGETVVLGVGDEARGYQVLSIDEEGGVRLRGPDGSELTLLPSSF